MWTLWGFAFVWLACGAATVLLMARRGYDAWSWGFVGLVYGVLSLPIALVWLARNHARGEELGMHAGRVRGGEISVLVGVDGSPESREAVRSVERVFGPRLRSLTLADVVDFDTADAMKHSSGHDFVEHADAVLRAAARDSAANPGTVVLTGPPAAALIDYARRHAVDIVAVGARGRGASNAVFGSVTDSLVRHSPIPVMVTGARRAVQPGCVRARRTWATASEQTSSRHS